MSQNDNTSEIKKPSFWISQACIIAATVVGVFLAANQGFKQAMLFDTIKTTQNNYYLRKSLQNELAANVGYIREFMAKVENRIDKPELVLETFVWSSMTYSSTSLETPSDLLREAQQFYRQANEIMNTPYFNNSVKAKNLGELADHIEKDVLPRFETNTEDLRKDLESKGSDV